MIDETFDYPEYLAIKQAIDNRSLNKNVWQVMTAWLKQHANNPDFKILEIGAGTGSMITRLLDAGLPDHCQYFAVELEAGFDRVAKDELSGWAGTHAYTMKTTGPSDWTLKSTGKMIHIQWLTADILEIDSCFDPGNFDMLIGHAIIDLLPVPDCMPGLLDLVKPGGGYYFSLNFAGETTFSPPHPRDIAITDAYHRDMDARFPEIEWRASQTGQVLGAWLKQQGHQVLVQGDSHWKLSTTPSPSATDNRFIGNILDTMEKALAGLEGLEDWLRIRRQQVDSGDLLFFAANRDYFGRTRTTDTMQGKQPDKKNHRIP